MRTHIKRTFVRLEARTRAHAVAIAYREGLVPQADEGEERLEKPSGVSRLVPLRRSKAP